jgi:hypothetical protein
VPRDADYVLHGVTPAVLLPWVVSTWIWRTCVALIPSRLSERVPAHWKDHEQA